MVVRWALTVKQNTGDANYQFWETTVIGEVTGTREQALAALWHHAVNFQPRHPRAGAKRRWVLRDGDGFLLASDGVTRDSLCEFRAYEILWDSAFHGQPSPT
ncbi:hypothetical protein [Streptomyces sp. 6N223]|uniref:hypothetical protein n=1 Tax=Streptomyces sp. 6N223 TaxID=3457412 RepID=UPI003FD11503